MQALPWDCLSYSALSLVSLIDALIFSSIKPPAVRPTVQLHPNWKNWAKQEIQGHAGALTERQCVCNVWERSKESWDSERDAVVWAYMQHCQQQSQVWNELAQWQVNQSPGCLWDTCINYDATFAKQASNPASIFSSYVTDSSDRCNYDPFLIHNNICFCFLDLRTWCWLVFFPAAAASRAPPPTRMQIEKVSTHGRQTKVSLSAGQKVFPLLMSSKCNGPAPARCPLLSHAHIWSMHQPACACYRLKRCWKHRQFSTKLTRGGSLSAVTVV